MPKISVIMPAYNAERYVGEAIESVLSQTFGDFEFLIIDDASTDSTESVIASFSDPRIRLLKNENNLGIARTLNRGLDEALGEYIARMDSDDVSLPERFEKQVRYLDLHPECDVLGCAIEEFGALSGIKRFSEDHETLKIDLIFGSCFAHPSVMMRADAIGKNALHYDPEFSKMEDWELWCRASGAHRLASLPDVLLKYRIHSGQVTQSHSPDKEAQEKRLVCRIAQNLGISEADAHPLIEYRTKSAMPTPDYVISVAAFFKTFKSVNRRAREYDSVRFDTYLDSITESLLSKLDVKSATRIAKSCGISPLSYLSRRAKNGIKARVKERLRVFK
jgi:hypothetical protein